MRDFHATISAIILRMEFENQTPQTWHAVSNKRQDVVNPGLRVGAVSVSNAHAKGAEIDELVPEITEL